MYQQHLQASATFCPACRQYQAYCTCPKWPQPSGNPPHLDVLHPRPPYSPFPPQGYPMPPDQNRMTEHPQGHVPTYPQTIAFDPRLPTHPSFHHPHFGQAGNYGQPLSLHPLPAPQTPQLPASQPLPHSFLPTGPSHHPFPHHLGQQQATDLASRPPQPAPLHPPVLQPQGHRGPPAPTPRAAPPAQAPAASAALPAPVGAADSLDMDTRDSPPRAANQGGRGALPSTPPLPPLPPPPPAPPPPEAYDPFTHSGTPAGAARAPPAAPGVRREWQYTTVTASGAPAGVPPPPPQPPPAQAVPPPPPEAQQPAPPAPPPPPHHQHHQSPTPPLVSSAPALPLSPAPPQQQQQQQQRGTYWQGEPPGHTVSLQPHHLPSQHPNGSQYSNQQQQQQQHLPQHLPPLPTAPAPRAAFRQSPSPPQSAPPPAPPAPPSAPSPSAAPAKWLDAAALFREPGRLARPQRFVVLLRGLPGSGKSHLARALRDVEVAQGGAPPRVFSLDDYFLLQDSDEEEEEGPAARRLQRGKRSQPAEPAAPRERYKFDAALEEPYRASMLKAFRRVLEEGRFSFLIVEDRFSRVAHFEPFWAAGKRAGYEVFVAQGPQHDQPQLCASRNVHGFSLASVQALADAWEAVPPHMIWLDVANLFRTDALSANDITEVDMDEEEQPAMAAQAEEEEGAGGALSFVSASYGEEGGEGEEGEEGPAGTAKKRGRADGGAENSGGGNGGAAGGAGDSAAAPVKLIPAVKGGRRSAGAGGLEGKQARRDRMRVQWGDNKGKAPASASAAAEERFSIGGSGHTVRGEKGLIIGPGRGYSLRSNPLPLADLQGAGFSLVGSQLALAAQAAGERRKRWQAQLRAEAEQFRSIMRDRRGGGGGF